MEVSENDHQKSAIAPFAPIAIPQPARLGEEAITVPAEHTGLDLKQEFFRFLDSCVAYRDTETKQQYAKDLAEALAARDTAKEHAQELQQVINANEQLIAELRRDMVNLQEDLERHRIVMKENDQCVQRAQELAAMMLFMDFEPVARGLGKTLNAFRFIGIAREMESLAREIGRVLDTFLPVEKTGQNSLGSSQADGVQPNV